MSNTTDWQQRVHQAFGFYPKPWERERLLEKCKIQGDCWVWKGGDHFVMDDRRYAPIAMAYVMLKGPIPANHKVGSTCGKTCCMPEHLVCFTQSKVA